MDARKVAATVSSRKKVVPLFNIILINTIRQLSI